MRFAQLVLAVAVALLVADGRQIEIATPAPHVKHLPSTIRRATIRIVGDIMQHSPQIAAAQRSDGYDYTECFDSVRALLSEADLTIANLETTLRPTPPYSGYPLFASPVELASAMADAGVDVALLANNHICDRGGTGLRRTIAALDSIGIAHTGAYANSIDFVRNNPLMTEVGGFKIAILNYTYGTNGMPIGEGTFVNVIDTTRIVHDMRKAATADIRLVCIHWGEEYMTRPNRTQRELAEWLYQHGATAIIGGHPHVMQPVEIRTDNQGHIHGVTYYSLGNFISNQTWAGTDGGMVATLHFEKQDGHPLSITPEYSYTWVHRHHRAGRSHYRVLPLENAIRHIGDSTAWRVKRFSATSHKISEAERRIVVGRFGRLN